MNEHVTLMQPDPREPAAAGISSGFPDDLLAQSAERLRVLALLYAFVFFMAGVFPGAVPTAGTRAILLEPLLWAPSASG